MTQKQTTDFDTLVGITNSGKKLSNYIATTEKQYLAISTRLHVTACMAVAHAAAYGECSHLNAFGNMLRRNDQAALRIWVAKVTPHGEPTENNRHPSFMAYKKEGGYRVKSGKEFAESRKPFTENMEDTLFNLFDGPSFMDIDQKTENALTPLQIMKAFKAAAAKVGKKDAELDDGEHVPQRVIKAAQAALSIMEEEVTKMEGAIAAKANDNAHTPNAEPKALPASQAA